MKKSLVVVDCQYDFINGSLACLNAENAVLNIIEFIKNEDVDVLYSADWHSKKHMSFKANGGIWVEHCVAGSKGAELSKEFQKLPLEKMPSEKNIFRKGTDDGKEEYSAFYAKNADDKTVNEVCGDEVIVCGIASEYCVRETALSLKNAGKTVYLYLNGVGFVNLQDHEKNIKDLKAKGIILI